MRSCRAVGLITCLLLGVLWRPSEAWSQLPIDSILHSEEQRQQCRIAMVVTDLSSGRRLVDYRSCERMIPASLVKLISSASALRLCGQDAVFTTEIGYSGHLRGDILDGDLVIRGSGDPSIETRYIAGEQGRFFSFVEETLLRSGIRHVTGDVVVDASALRPAATSASWLYEDLGEYYGAALYGFNILDNRMALLLESSDTEVCILSVDPLEAEADVVNHLDIGSRSDLHINGAPLSHLRRLSGSLPPSRTQVLCPMELPNPAKYAATAIRQKLASVGIAVDGQARAFYTSEQVASPTRSLGLYRSLPLREIVGECNRRSINLCAEAFVCMLDEGKPRSFKGGYKRLIDYWVSRGMDSRSISLFDGSGLSPKNRITSIALEQLLMAMSDRSVPSGMAFYDSLPVAGRDGSVKHLSTPEGLVARLKSGSMYGVQGYAGYAQVGQREFALIFMANDFTDRASIRRTLQAVMDELVRGLPE
ncbi:MAG: D-alanyl-D-alanine carboxypeptidase/D-alanyl-D-alanine-endopeptidase [Porphyromonas sp.]|nr:D-alanyl-D-alanine carboxypeptidase/D-alanyl-D-alanine-endopeptidase [Porphyromonas sp.]